ncbi:ribonuclease [Chitinibacter sp. SCUT-21]|uniref:ribonuclease domain-containing protein n=1 Tax=Chitinibacter sp. SCUT-21 TaxID=2970891 RepID=UPI0035A6196F
MKIQRIILSLLANCIAANLYAAMPSCNEIAQRIAHEKHIPAAELSSILASLNQFKRLPDQFVTKRVAQAAGWRPGESLWDSLPGKSIGGDRFGNREQRLPKGHYFEADLDYQGKKRNAKRIVFQNPGKRYITIDHYNTFTEIPACS